MNAGVQPSGAGAGRPEVGDRFDAAAGWFADPWGIAQLRFWDGVGWTAHVAPPPAANEFGAGRVGARLDQIDYEMRLEDPAPWGWRLPVLLPIVAFIVEIVAVSAVSATVKPKTYGGKVLFDVVGNLAIEVLLVLVVWLAGRDIAARHGGWGRAFGWRRPRWADLGYGAAGFAVIFVAQVFVGLIANALTNGHATSESQNLEIHHVTPFAVVMLFLIVVVCGPVVEELVFRGLLLRTFMRRFGFWPAAALSTLIFALFHTYEVDTVAGAVTLAANVACLGLVNCVLNRYTDRLAAGIGVHASFNLLALTLVLAQAGRG